ncbi:lycopene cyclase family protein [soil metagenome]
MRMLDSRQFADKKILLIDKDDKKTNDRTWCFWEAGENYFNGLVYKQWEHLCIKNSDEILDLKMGNYTYKMIRGIDFYNYSFNRIAKAKNITFLKGIIQIEYEKEKTKITVDNQTIDVNNAVVFNSLYQQPRQKNKIYLLQHFKGWTIETPEDAFDDTKATLMDFTINQSKGTAFMYVLPFSKTKALIEFTLFTSEVLQPKEYDDALKNYISSIVDSYQITEEEFGVIPMTNADFKFIKNGMYHIGTAGGQTKPTTGYTFKFIQQHSQQIVDCLIANKLPTEPKTTSRFRFYDSTFLKVLSEQNIEGKKVFFTLFKKNSAEQVFKFLDNETAVVEELKIISTLPVKEFLIAGLSVISMRHLL